jgi:hypothetical protein
MGGPRISYVEVRTLSDPRMLAEFERARREGTPRPESHAIRAHVPAVFWSFVNTWNDVFVNGVVDHSLKELCRVFVSKVELGYFVGVTTGQQRFFRTLNIEVGSAQAVSPEP